MPITMINIDALPGEAGAVVKLIDERLPWMQGDLALAEGEDRPGRLSIYAVKPALPAADIAIVRERLYRKATGTFLNELFRFADEKGITSIALPLFGEDSRIPHDRMPARLYRDFVTLLSTAAENTDIEDIFLQLTDEQTKELLSSVRHMRDMALGYIAQQSSLPQSEAFSLLQSQITESYVLPEEAYSIPKTALRLSASFGTNLDKLIDSKGVKPGDFVRRANISRQTLCKLRSGDTVPEKYTALACALALELNLSETTELLRSAGYSLSPSLKMDVIVAYFIARKMYDIDAINLVLYEQGVRPLGSRM